MLETLDLEQVSAEVLSEIAYDAKRPIIIFGAGMRHAASEAKDFAELLNLPICPTWGALDLFPGCVGSFGTHGVRAANWAVQNADYILCIGARLDTKATGSPASSFAPKAKLVMVDIDEDEYRKMEKIGRPLYRGIRSDAREFLRMIELHARTRREYDASSSTFRNYDHLSWLEEMKAKKEVIPGEPYDIVRKLGDYISKDDIIVSDTGCVLPWMMQAYPFKGERFIHAFNQTPMGCGLPMAIGACFATGKRVWLVTGDGGLSVCSTEMGTAVKHNLPVTVVLFNNESHGMCLQTERQWFGGEYCGTSSKDIATPDFQDIARAYRFMSYGPNSISFEGLDDTLTTIARFKHCPAFLEIPIDREFGVHGQIKFGEPLAEAA